ncbi:MAG: UDP-N-acetylmuramate--L-alanine ligase [Halobacteriovoraceae bacterium]|nr:UDP-N-acetylmuramate--L-alanine ligase [Halobacteriovoraceae bacterium]
MFNQESICIHFIGIGGIGMSGIAEVLLSLGHQVSGSDIMESPRTQGLQRSGAKIFIGHKEENLQRPTVVVYSSAIKENNPEFIGAKKRKIPLMKRAEMLAELMRLNKKGIAIAGTHGKTTTTSFLATILQESSLDPTYIIGGVVNNLNGHAKTGGGDLLVVEADESDGSFLLLNPTMSVITNIDDDHMDFYQSKEELVNAFHQFANKVPFYGCCALNADDEKSMLIKGNMKKPWITYGVEDGNSAEFSAKNIRHFPYKTEYDLYYKNEFAEQIVIKLPGIHNVSNSLGAISLAFNMKISFKQISQAIEKFEGVDRRLDILFDNGKLEVIDDYAHHPTEINKTLEIIRNTRKDSTIIVVFEPHRFSRTKYCWNSFLHCFNHADRLFLGPIYPASEKPIDGINTERMVEDINHLHPNFARLLNNLDEMPLSLDDYGKVSLVTLGAGSIGKKVREFIKRL